MVSGHLEVVRVFCEAGTAKGQANQDGATPVFSTSGMGRLEVVRFLCEARAAKGQAKQGGVYYGYKLLNNIIVIIN